MSLRRESNAFAITDILLAKLFFVYVSQQSDNCSAQSPSAHTLLMFEGSAVVFGRCDFAVVLQGSGFNPPLIMLTSSAAIQELFLFFHV